MYLGDLLRTLRIRSHSAGVLAILTINSNKSSSAKSVLRFWKNNSDEISSRPDYEWYGD